MHTLKKKYLIIFIACITVIILPLFLVINWYPPHIQQRAAGGTTVGQYQKFELSYPYGGNYTNPNDPSQADLEAVFTAPSGTQQKVPGFYFQDYIRNGTIQQQTLTPTGAPQWKVRFAPSEIGSYAYTVTLKDTTGIKTLDTGIFTSISSNNPGFVRANGVHLVQDNGQPFFMLGVNAPGWQPYQTWQGHPWKWGDGTFGVDNLYQQMNANGLNWYHLWTCQAFATPNIGCAKAGGDPAQMSQPDSWEIDYAINQAEMHHIYTSIVLHWGDPTYDPYDPIKARYFVARWGYSPQVVAWDYQKEISTDPQATSAWSSYVKSVDPYNHLRTTTQWNHYAVLGPGNLKTFNAVFGDPNMTMVQNHDYMSDCNDVITADTSLFYFSIYADADPRSSRRFNKPSFNGEGGLSSATNCQFEGGGLGESPLVLTDHAGVILKGYIWGTFMSTLAGTAAWWYYTDPQAGWSQFTPFQALSAYAQNLPIVPDSAATFTSYNDTSQAGVSSTNLRIIGRKNTNFAMGYIQNITGTWSAIVRDHKTPTPIQGTVVLHNMVGTFTVKWFDIDGGKGIVIKTDTVTANSGLLTLSLPQAITQSTAFFATTSTLPTTTPTDTPSISISPTATPAPTITSGLNSTVFAITICPHGLGNCGDSKNTTGGNRNPLHTMRNITLAVSTGATPLSTQSGQVTYNTQAANFQGTITVPNLSSGTYNVTIKMDGFLSKQLTVAVTATQQVNLPLVSLINGDITNDDQLDISDYNALISCYGNNQGKSICLYPSNSNSSRADILDDDKQVDGEDYNQFLREFSTQQGL